MIMPMVALASMLLSSALIHPSCRPLQVYKTAASLSDIAACTPSVIMKEDGVQRQVKRSRQRKTVRGWH